MTKKHWAVYGIDWRVNRIAYFSPCRALSCPVWPFSSATFAYLSTPIKPKRQAIAAATRIIRFAWQKAYSRRSWYSQCVGCPMASLSWPTIKTGCRARPSCLRWPSLISIRVLIQSSTASSTLRLGVAILFYLDACFVCRLAIFLALPLNFQLNLH